MAAAAASARFVIVIVIATEAPPAAQRTPLWLGRCRSRLRNENDLPVKSKESCIFAPALFIAVIETFLILPQQAKERRFYQCSNLPSLDGCVMR
jgi:hypothetical protein